MKKTLFFSAALLSASLVMGQRINNITFAEVTTLGYGAEANPTNNSETKTGRAFVILPPNTSLDNLTATINCGTEAAVTEPSPLPTNWNAPVRMTVTSTKDASWAKYDITCRVIKPSSLPIEQLFTDNTGKRLSEWTTATEGFASAGCSETDPYAKVGSAGRGFFLAFSEAPGSITNTIFVATATDAPENKFDIDESVDGITWTNIIQYIGTGNETNQMSLSNATPAQKIRSYDLKATTRFVRYWYKFRSAGNVTVTDITVSKSSSSSINTPNLLEAKTFIENGELVVTSEENVAKIQIYNNGGQLLKEVNNVSRVNLSDLTAGSLLIKVLGESGKGNSYHLAK